MIRCIRAAGWLFTVISLAGLSGACALGLVLFELDRSLPDYRQLKDYTPAVMTRVHAADGSILAEYAKERRLFVPIAMVPKRVVGAFLSAEDKHFYSHSGIDPVGTFRALLSNLRHVGSGRRPEGGSTITQQVAKNFFLNGRISYWRKLEEAMLALRIEQLYPKDKILELYLNEIYFGSGAYGIGAAALTYFGRSVAELSLPQMAYLACLPKAPNNYDPLRNHDAAVARRNWVIGQMARNGYISDVDALAAQAAPLGASASTVPPRLTPQAGYFADEVRRQLVERYGETTVYTGGLSVRTTLDRRLQRLARVALVNGLVQWDQREGYRGAIANVSPDGDWGITLASQRQLNDISPWRLAIVLKAGADNALIGLTPPRLSNGTLAPRRDTGILTTTGVQWVHWATGPLRGKAVSRVDEVVKVGDVIYVEPSNAASGQYDLRQIPEISGAMVVIDPSNGDVLAMVGGFSFDFSNFNRATQAYRQPGSSFKPFVYAAALDEGYTPASLVPDEPLAIDMGVGQPPWQPANDGGKYHGLRTLRFGLQWSRNVMAVRLAQDIGMPLIAAYARRFGIYDNLSPYIAMALGSGETTLMRLTTAYAMLANGGKRLKPSLVDRIQDRSGRVIYRHDERLCPGCGATTWRMQAEPVLVDHREQVLDPRTAYQITSMLESVVQDGTARVLQGLGPDIAGKTGTTNEARDVWFVGYSPQLVAGVYVGYDDARPLGHEATGGRIAAPIFGDFMKSALADQPRAPFAIPTGIKLIPIDANSGQRASSYGPPTLLEAFKVGTAPSGITEPTNEISNSDGSQSSKIGTEALY